MAARREAKTVVTARDVLRLLRARHSEDLFVPECKNGPTQTRDARPLRMDAWVMPRSWRHPWITAYEIKVSRGDFLNDKKWPLYLPLCNSLYFVCPPDVIQKDEVPEAVGLLHVSKNCAKLYTRKKAPRREVEVPQDVFRYVLMCRSEIREEHKPMSRQQYWADWLAQKEANRKLGYQVSEALQQKYERDVEAVEQKQLHLKRQLQGFEELQKILKNAGIGGWDDWEKRRRLEKRLSQSIVDEVPARFQRDLEELGDGIQRLLARWKELQESNDNNNDESLTEDERMLRDEDALREIRGDDEV